MSPTSAYTAHSFFLVFLLIKPIDFEKKGEMDHLFYRITKDIEIKTDIGL